MKINGLELRKIIKEELHRLKLFEAKQMSFLCQVFPDDLSTLGAELKDAVTGRSKTGVTLKGSLSFSSDDVFPGAVEQFISSDGGSYFIAGGPGVGFPYQNESMAGKKVPATLEFFHSPDGNARIFFEM